MEPDRCRLCSALGVVAMNGAWFCLDHIDDGFRFTVRGVAILRGLQPEDIDAAEETFSRLAAEATQRALMTEHGAATPCTCIYCEHQRGGRCDCDPCEWVRAQGWGFT